jgi:photosystem II stability/assembly factor-like uncharacterized protein
MKRLWITVTLLLLLAAPACIQTAPGTLEPETEQTATQTSPAAPAETETATLLPTETQPAADTPAPTATEELQPTASPSPAAATPEGEIVASPALVSLDMKNEAAGWGLTESQALRTADGGSTWMDVTPDDLAAEAITRGFFLDTDTGWILSAELADPEAGQLFRTVDGGASWESDSTPFGFAQLYFIDPAAGWALVDRGAGAGSQAVEIQKTTNGGETWEMVSQTDPDNPDDPQALPFSGIKSGISFSDESHGWVGGSIPMDGFIYLYGTADGGGTWQRLDLPLPAGFENAQTSTDPPVFFSPQEGVLPVRLFAERSATVFYLSGDGGVTWIPGQPVEEGGVFAVGSPQDFFVWGDMGLSVSHDGGATWTTLGPNVNLRETLAALEFAGASAGWALTIDAEGSYLLYRTVDGGESWTPIE